MKNVSGKTSNGMQPYKGVRDFYPEDQRIQNYIFSAMRRAVESYGYEEMNASVLEPTDLYLSKTSEEIVNEQTYTFEDRGGRSVTLRPEMTPTVARMVAARRRELGFPLRWYSIQNLFRYEKPQRGRLREHWQLNADLFGVPGIEAEIEIISVAYKVMKELGALDETFVIRINSRKLMHALYQPLAKDGVEMAEVFRLLDKREKLDQKTFEAECAKLFKGPFQEASAVDNPTLNSLLDALGKRGIKAEFAPSILRGFDYYTDIVFEVFDTNPKNPRALFGGGRYDNLIEQYGGDSIPAIGFGMGDVTTRDFLETHGLLKILSPAARLYLAPVSSEQTEAAAGLADTLRMKGVNVALGMKHTKVADHIKAAVKLGIPYFAAYGADEVSSNTLKIKNLATGEEKQISLSDVPGFLKLEAES